MIPKPSIDWPRASTTRELRPGVDLSRAQVQLANDQQALLAARNQYKQALLVLARNLGMSPGTPLELAEPLRFQPLNHPTAEVIVGSALLARSDYLSLASQRQQLVRAATSQQGALLPEAQSQRKLRRTGSQHRRVCRQPTSFRGKSILHFSIAIETGKRRKLRAGLSESTIRSPTCGAALSRTSAPPY